MRYSEFKESTLFKKASDAKYRETINDLIAQGVTFRLGPNGDEGTFKINAGQEVTTNTQILQGEGVKIDTATGNEEPIDTIKANQLYKSTAIMNIQAGRPEDAVTQSAGKEKHIVKPSQIFKDERFPADQVFDEVIKNPVLMESEIGKYIIKMAEEIAAGNLPSLKDIPKEYHTTIRDYAGEYLGVLCLLKGIANFPGQDAWYQHLGVKDLSGIYINFPQQSNFALGDSIGSFENAETGNMILISSKGGSKGAPPSLNNLKIPDNYKGKPEYENTVKVIETLQKSTAADQPFRGANALFEVAPETISKPIRDILPFSDGDINELVNLMTPDDAGAGIDALPERYHPIVAMSQRGFSDRALPGGMVHYIVTGDIMNAVNKRNALPEFEPMAREILQQNFIQIFARPKQGILTFDVLWPNREMAQGKVELYSKAASTDPRKAKMSFSVT